MRQMRALSLDDEIVNLRIIEEISQAIDLEVVSFGSPADAALCASREVFDIAFVDYLLPHMDGIEFIKQLRRYLPDIPVVMITAIVGDSELKYEALRAGATDFLTKPIDPADFTARVRNLLSLREAQLLLHDRALLLEQEVRKATHQITRRENETLQVLGKAAEYKDPETANHVTRVSNYCRMLSEILGQSEKEQEIIYHASMLHDVGKIGISDKILLKPGGLTADEFEIMRSHTVIGSEILKSAQSEYLSAGRVIALTHHERWDGEGYPNRIAGSEIPLAGRIAAVADVFDALVSKRPYKEAWTFDDSMQELISIRGKQLDAGLVDIFIDNAGAVEQILKTFRD